MLRCVFHINIKRIIEIYIYIYILTYDIYTSMKFEQIAVKSGGFHPVLSENHRQICVNFEAKGTCTPLLFSGDLYYLKRLIVEKG